MAGWWYKYPRSLSYLVRESTAFFIFFYALLLLYGCWAYSQGPDEYNHMIMALQSNLATCFHLITLIAIGVHIVTWFNRVPKLLPFIFIGRHKISDVTVIAVLYLVAASEYVTLIFAGFTET